MTILESHTDLGWILKKSNSGVAGRVQHYILVKKNWDDESTARS